MKELIILEISDIAKIKSEAHIHLFLEKGVSIPADVLATLSNNKFDVTLMDKDPFRAGFEAAKKFPAAELFTALTQRKRTTKLNAEVSKPTVSEKRRQIQKDFMNKPADTVKSVNTAKFADTAKPADASKYADTAEEIVKKAKVDPKFTEGVRKVLEKKPPKGSLAFNLHLELTPWQATKEDEKKLLKAMEG